MGDAHLHWGGQIALLSPMSLMFRMLISFRNTFTDTPRNNIYPNIWVPCDPIKLTDKIHHRTSAPGGELFTHEKSLINLLYLFHPAAPVTCLLLILHSKRDSPASLVYARPGQLFFRTSTQKGMSLMTWVVNARCAKVKTWYLPSFQQEF